MDDLEQGLEVWTYDGTILHTGFIDCRHVGFQDEAYYVNVREPKDSFVRRLIFRESIFVKNTDRERLAKELQNTIAYTESMLKSVKAEN